MKLTVMERITLLGLLPEQGGFSTMKALTELRGNLYTTEKETKQWGIEQDETKITWKENGTAEVPVGEIMKALVVSKLQTLDKEEKLTANHLSLWEKFIEGK
jgi:hypothetical protein